MKMLIISSLSRIAMLGATLCCLAPLDSRAALIYGVTQFNELVSFDSAAPGTILSTAPISGLSNPSEGVAGIDFRPATGELYALGNAPGSQYRLYTLNLATGAATQLGANVLSFSSSAFGFGFDFNPVADRIRIVNDAEESGRLNPNDGTYIADTALNSLVPAPFYQGSIVAAAYTNNFDGATSTQLFDIDYLSGSLFEQTPPNAGTLESVGGLNTSLSGNAVGFDISGSTGIAYLSDSDFDSNSNPFANLFTVNLATGEATFIGAVGQGIYLRDISVFLVPEPSSLGMLILGAGMLGLRRRRK